jgi:8-oxo-dGTP diphosphatase
MTTAWEWYEGTFDEKRRIWVDPHLRDGEHVEGYWRDLGADPLRDEEGILRDPSKGDGWYRNGDGVVRWGRFGAAGILFRHTENGVARYFLQRRGEGIDDAGTWGIPGGALDEGEDPLSGALRETAEETGVVYKPGDLHVVGSHSFQPAPDWAYTTHVVETLNRFGPTATNWEGGESGWFTADEMGAMPLHPGLATALPSLTGQNAGKPAPPLDVLYHVAPTAVREHISSEGLQTSASPESYGNAPGVYFWRNAEQAREDAANRAGETRVPYDVWEVDAHDLPQNWDQVVASAVYTPSDVPASRITLLKGSSKGSTASDVKRRVYVHPFTRHDGVHVEGHWREIADVATGALGDAARQAIPTPAEFLASWEEMPDFKTMAEADAWWQKHYPWMKLKLEKTYDDEPLDDNFARDLEPTFEEYPEFLRGMMLDDWRADHAALLAKKREKKLIDTDPETMVPVLQRFNQLAHEYPTVARHVSFLETGPIESGGAVADSWTGPVPRESWAHLLSRAQGPMPEGGASGTVLRSGWWGVGNAPAFKHMMKQTESSGFNVPGAKDAASVMTHEFGHHIFYWIKMQGGAKNNELVDDITNTLGTVATHLKPSDLPSQYAATNLDEAVAESFTANYYSPAKTKELPFVKAVNDLMKKWASGDKYEYEQRYGTPPRGFPPDAVDAAKSVAFQEVEHPRDLDGRFAQKFDGHWFGFDENPIFIARKPYLQMKDGRPQPFWKMIYDPSTDETHLWFPDFYGNPHHDDIREVGWEQSKREPEGINLAGFGPNWEPDEYDLENLEPWIDARLYAYQHAPSDWGYFGDELPSEAELHKDATDEIVGGIKRLIRQYSRDMEDVVLFAHGPQNQKRAESTWDWFEEAFGVKIVDRGGHHHDEHTGRFVRYSFTGTASPLSPADRTFMEKVISGLTDGKEFTSGGAKNVDTVAAELAKKHHPEAHHRGVFPAAPYDKEAEEHVDEVIHVPPTRPEPEDKSSEAYRKWKAEQYMRRNDALVEYAKPDLEVPEGKVIAFPRGPETLRSGTWATVRRARKAGVPVEVHQLPGG